MILTCLLSGSSDNENGTWTQVGPSGPATSLRGNVLGTGPCGRRRETRGLQKWSQGDGVAGLRGSQERFWNWMRGKERVDGVVAREGARPLGQTLGVQKVLTGG